MKRNIIYLLLISCLISSCSGKRTEALDEGVTSEIVNSQEIGNSQETEDLEEVKNSEEESVQVLPPGTLPEVSQIPQPDQSIVGELKEYSFDNYENLIFAYYYNEDTKEERMVMIEVPPLLNSKYPKLWILETTFGGWDGLRKHFTLSFEATVLAYKHISFEESEYAYNATVPGSGMAEYYNEGEVMDFSKEINKSNTIEYYLGRICKTCPENTHDTVMNEIENGSYVAVLSNASEVESERLKSRKETFESIYKRFGLKEVISVE